MKTKLIALIVYFLIVSVQLVEAKPKALLRLNLEKGDTYQMTLTSDNNIDQQMMGQQMKILQKMEMVSSYKVLDKLADNSYVIEYSFVKMKMDMDVNGQKVTIDSESTGEDVVSKTIKDVTSLKLKFTMNSMGKIQTVEGIDEYKQRIGNNPQLVQALTMLSDENNFKSNFEQYFGFYPENEIEPGSKWDYSIKMPAMMNMDMLMHFNVTDIQKDLVVLDTNSDINMDSPMEQNGMKIQLKMTGTQSGTMKIDRKSGLAGTSDLNQKFDMNMKMKNPQSGEDMEIPMQMNAVTKISTVKI
ncbi:MAG TPA: DUF6263 family protein [Prolixibacteraceae bacterium]|nr:DUF6263 family protein [Prolixibacteraceae bacterium]